MSGKEKTLYSWREFNALPFRAEKRGTKPRPIPCPFRAGLLIIAFRERNVFGCYKIVTMKVSGAENLGENVAFFLFVIFDGKSAAQFLA